MTALAARWALVAAMLSGATAAAILSDGTDSWTLIALIAAWCLAAVNVVDWRVRRREHGIRTTGVKLLPRGVARRLGTWSAWEQLDCPHPTHRERLISGDERNHGYRQQCMDCGLFTR